MDLDYRFALEVLAYFHLVKSNQYGFRPEKLEPLQYPNTGSKLNLTNMDLDLNI